MLFKNMLFKDMLFNNTLFNNMLLRICYLTICHFCLFKTFVGLLPLVSKGSLFETWSHLLSSWT